MVGGWVGVGGVFNLLHRWQSLLFICSCHCDWFSDKHDVSVFHSVCAGLDVHEREVAAKATHQQGTQQQLSSWLCAGKRGLPAQSRDSWQKAFPALLLPSGATGVGCAEHRCTLKMLFSLFLLFFSPDFIYLFIWCFLLLLLLLLFLADSMVYDMCLSHHMCRNL